MGLKKLQPRHHRFIDALIKGSNNADAVRIAGFKAKNPSNAANQLLKDPLIREVVEKRTKEIETQTKLSSQDTAVMLSQIARGEREATSQTVRALELMAKINGMLVDKVETKDTTEMVDAVISSIASGDDVVKVA